jgi:hypothetical protein
MPSRPRHRAAALAAALPACLALGLLAHAGPAAAAGDAAAEPPRPAPGPPVAPEDLTLPEYLGHAVGLRQLPDPGQRPDQRFHWTVLPFVVLNPLMGAGGGAATILGARLGPKETTSFSSLEASGFLTAEGQHGIAIRTDVRFPGDGWVLVGDLGAGHFPNPAWGLGGETPESARTILHRTQVTLHQTLYRRLAGPFHAGLGWAFDDFTGLESDRPVPSGAGTYDVGTRGRSVTSSLALHLLWDGRDNRFAPTRGTYLMARLRGSHDLLGSETRWRSLYLDARTYLRVPGPGRDGVLALWALGWSAYGRPPYLLLPSVGADPDHRTGRGWVEGRWTGKDLLYAEAEYRFHLWQFLSGVLAVNATAVSDRGVEGQAIHFERLHPAAVAGVRALLSGASQARLAFDVAWAPGQAPAFYLAANEAF